MRKQTDLDEIKRTAITLLHTDMRTMAFQVPEELFQRIKGYLQRNNMSQKQFVLGLIEAELDREQAQRNDVTEDQQTGGVDTEEGISDDPEAVDGTDEDETEDETEGFGMSMGGM